MRAPHAKYLALIVSLAVALAIALPTRSATAQIPGGLNVDLSASPSTAQIGQTITFTYRASPPAVAPPFASITSVSVDFGDGQTGTGNTGNPGQTINGTLTHAYTSPGVFTPALSTQASNGGHGSTTTSVTITGSALPPQPSGTITYGQGWNLIGVPDGTALPPNGGLYTWQAGDTGYEAPSATQAGKGYWAYFFQPSNALFLATTNPSPSTVRVPLPAGQFIMIGNPYTGNAAISGADVFFAYDPEHGYRQVTTLFPGLGAWAFSAAGGAAVISAAP